MIKIAVVGYGNIGKSAIEAVQAAPDMKLVGVVRSDVSTIPVALAGIEVVDHVDKLQEKPQVAILCTPTRLVEKTAEIYLQRGIHTVDSFDIHSKIWDLKCSLDSLGKQHQAVSVIAAGWDPGSDSMVRTLLEAAAPRGITYTNFGPGMSMGHTVAVKAMEGVAGALSMTIPLGTGIHRRMVYVELAEGYSLEEVSARIKADPYFSSDETHVVAVEDVQQYLDKGHGVEMVRKGVSGTTDNQLFSFSMKINNPALTAQIMTSAARAATKQTPGAYTLIELPVVDLLPGDRENWIRRLV